ncbi:MAG: helix-turn-helix transcriptional regulator [Acidobacteria bacterium]|nr:helix-turn-helix transcriptional regulator [Acidobacteriota bacterium]
MKNEIRERSESGLCQCSADSADDERSSEKQTGGMTPLSLRLVIDYIQENLAEELRLDTLAEVAGLSRYRFSHNFKQATGFAPHQFIVRERLERAKRMLRETDLTVLAISFAVGFSSPSRFTYIFRQQIGMTPSEYRAELQPT